MRLRLAHRWRSLMGRRGRPPKSYCAVKAQSEGEPWKAVVSRDHCLHPMQGGGWKCCHCPYIEGITAKDTAKMNNEPLSHSRGGT